MSGYLIVKIEYSFMGCVGPLQDFPLSFFLDYLKDVLLLKKPLENFE